MDGKAPLPQPHSASLARRLRHGLERLCAVLRADSWPAAGALRLNPTQAAILSHLADRGGARVTEIATHLGVTQPTASDSIAALERKGLVTRAADRTDARVVPVRATEAGQAAAHALDDAETATERALATLAPAEQVDLLLLIVKLIRSLQLAGTLPAQRMCPSCRYFRPNAHKGEPAPHHCAFVDAAFGVADLRLDCADHAGADLSAETDAWRTFAGEGAALPCGPFPQAKGQEP